MKRVFTLLILIGTCAVSFASGNSLIIPSKIVPVKKASEVFVPIGKSGQKISLQDLSNIKVNDFEKITGQKMKLAEKVGFKLTQRQLRKSINADGTINNNRLNKFLSRYEEGGFHFGGFALGFFLGLIGVLIAYLINDDKKHDRVKWAWLGLAVIVVLEILLFVAL
jgi:hypothetical protein